MLNSHIQLIKISLNENFCLNEIFKKIFKKNQNVQDLQTNTYLTVMADRHPKTAKYWNPNEHRLRYAKLQNVLITDKIFETTYCFRGY